MPPGSPTGWRVSDGLPFGSRIVCRCMHVPRVCVGPSADRCLGSRLRLCDAAQHAVQVPASSRRCGAFPAAGSGRLRPADAPSAGAGCTARPEHRRAHTRAPRVRPTSAARAPTVEAPPPAEGAFVAGGRRLTRFRWAAGSGRAGSGGRRCERAAVPAGCGCGQTSHIFDLRCTWAASLTEQSKQDLKQTVPSTAAVCGRRTPGGAVAPRGAASRRGGSPPGPPRR